MRFASFRSHHHSERGFTVTFFALLIALLIMTASLVIDHSRLEVSVQSLQRSADAAALGAARRLNGRLDGWWDAKKAAVISLRANPISGANTDQLAALKFRGGSLSFWDQAENITLQMKTGLPKGAQTPASIPGSEAAAGSLKVSVERGLFWYDSDSAGKYRFISLESDEDGLKGAVPYYLVANAVRVSVTLERLPTVFGGIFARSEFNNLNRESIAVMDSNLSRPVAPIAIPLCQLLLNMNPNVTSGDQIGSVYRPGDQCVRASYAAETNAKGEVQTNMSGGQDASPSSTTVRERRDGLVRAESFDRPAYFTGYRKGVPNLCFDGFTGSAHNCKALPLYGTLGVPALSPGGNATADEVQEAFVNGTYSAKIGAFFKPLSSVAGLSRDSARAEMARAVQASPSTFRNVFLDAGGRPKANYPFLRTKHINPQSADPQRRPEVSGDGWEFYDRTITMPLASEMFGSAAARFVMLDMAELPGSGAGIDPQLNFSNPMCHDDNIVHNDPDNSRVMEVDAMVVVPGVELKNGGDLVKYCDFANVFKGSEQDAVAPIAESNPTVVGFVKVNVFDLNFQRLATRPKGVVDPANPKVVQTANTPVYLNGAGALWDGNPAGLNLFDQNTLDAINQFEEEYEANLECTTGPGSGQGSGQGTGDTGGVACPPVPAFPLDATTITPEWFECFELGEITARWNYVASLGDSATATPEGLQAIQALADLLAEPVESRPDKHCLPRLKDRHYNRNDINAYQPIQNLDPGLGCGGLRLKLDCGTENTVIPTGRDYGESAPTLVTLN